MSCLDAEDIARAALLDDAAFAPGAHVATCLDCRRRLAADRTARDAIRRLSAPRLTGAHRRELAAEIFAAAQHLPLPRRRTRRPAIAAATAIALAAAAAATLVARWPHPASSESAAPQPVAAERVEIRGSSIAFVEPPPAALVPREMMSLADGNLVVDTRTTPDVDVRVGDSVIRVDDSAVRIQARRGKVISVQVIVGAAEIRTGAQRVRIERDSLWVAPDRADTTADESAVPTPQQQAMATFRAAWLALRAGNQREAIELFDRVTDPVAREEAMYWAMIAAERLGDAELARARRAKFSAEFPQSSLDRR